MSNRKQPFDYPFKNIQSLILFNAYSVRATHIHFYRLRSIFCKTLREIQPVYLHSMLATSLPSHSLRSKNDNSLSVPRVKTNIGARAFHSCAPSLWNNLPLSVCSAISVVTFRKHLKTHLFDWALSPIDTGMPDGLLMLWKCFLDFAGEH